MHALQSFKIQGTRTPFFMGSKAPKGVCPSVPQLPISWLGSKTPATREVGARDFMNTKKLL